MHKQIKMGMNKLNQNIKMNYKIIKQIQFIIYIISLIRYKLQS